LITSVVRMGDEKPAFRASNLWVGGVSLTGERYNGPPARVATLDRLAEQLRQIPGVDDVSFAGAVPPRSYAGGLQLTIAGAPAPGRRGGPSSALSPMKRQRRSRATPGGWNRR